MRKYTLVVNYNKYIVESRDAKKHLRNHGGDEAKVYNLNETKLISMAIRGEDGKIYSCQI